MVGEKGKIKFIRKPYRSKHFRKIRLSCKVETERKEEKEMKEGGKKEETKMRSPIFRGFGMLLSTFYKYFWP